MDTTHADYIDDSNDVGDIAQHTTADNHAFKKQSQTVGRPPVTNHNIHDDYMRDPPDNLDTLGEVSTQAKARDVKEGAREGIIPEREGLLGDEPTSRVKKDATLGALANKNTVHQNATS